MENKKPEAKFPYHPTWCHGCGNWPLWVSVNNAIKSCGHPPEKIVFFYDVGCSGDMSDFNTYFGFHSLHGRALPTAVGAKLANHDLKVVVVIGDGGCYGEGGTHFLNLMRGNHDITVLVHDNHRYSLTTGQMSPTTDKGTKTKSTPEGSIEEPLNPIAIALSNHASFVARQFSPDMPALTKRIIEGINHTGFALIDIFQPCVVFNPGQSEEWYRERIISLDKEKHDPVDLEDAWKQAMRTDKLPVGLYYKEIKPAHHEQVSELAKGPLIKQKKDTVDLTNLLEEFE